MRRALRLLRWNDVLLHWRVYFLRRHTLTRHAALKLLQRTTAEAQFSANGRAGRSPLANKNQSVMIWRTLAHHKVEWTDCLALMQAQWTVLSPEQKEFLKEGLRCPESWHQMPYLMAEAWQPATDLSGIYASLLVSKTIVQFANLVYAALRERPQLGGILLVTPQVLMRCYELGKSQPEVALALCRVLALSNTRDISKVDKESLAFAYAMLYAQKSQWNIALSVLNSSRDVRPSAKRLFRTYTLQRTQWAKAITSLKTVEPQFVAEAITHAPHWFNALRTLERWKSHEAISAFLARPDCVNAIGWEAALRLCTATRVDRYSLLRCVLVTIPSDHPQLMQLHTYIIRPVGEMMYAGTLTRRAYNFVQSGSWAEAIGLLSACYYYDVALPLVPYVSRDFALPHDLLKYEEAVHRIKSSACSLPDASFEEQLAIALHGDWTKLTDMHDNARLKSLILARRLTSFTEKQKVHKEEVDEEEEKEGNGIQCFTFQSEELSRIVCCNSGIKARRYFIQVIPRTLRRHHFGVDKIPPLGASASRRYEKFVLSNAVVSDQETCGILCAMVVEYLRARGKLTGQAFLKEIARCLASGKIQLSPADWHRLPLEVLRASTYFHRLDATMTTRIAFSTPSQHLMRHPEALEKSMNAMVLTGQWERAISFLERSKGPPYPEHLAVLAYAAPQSVALKVLTMLWKDHSKSDWILLLYDLVKGDIRFAQEEFVYSTWKKVKSGGSSHMVDEKEVFWRRRILGACCTLLQSSESMQYIVKTANVSSFCSLDMDEYGLQRLLPMFSWEQALTAITDLYTRGEVVEEHWSLLVCTKPSIPLDIVEEIVTSWFPYSFLLQSVLVHQRAIASGDLVAAIKSIARYHLLVVTEYRSSSTYLRPFVSFIKNILDNFDYSDDGDSWRKASAVWSIVRRLFNQVVENSKFVHLGREARRSISFPLSEEGPLAAVFILGFLYQKLGRLLQVPVRTAIVSRLLRAAALHTDDSQTALYFFKCLKRPNDVERSLLVFSLRDSHDAMTLLLNTGRFVLPRPEQVLLWSDPQLGRERWLEAIKLLSQSPPSHEFLMKLCANWTMEESMRALKLLQRTHANAAEAARPYVALVEASQGSKLKSV